MNIIEKTITDIMYTITSVDYELAEDIASALTDDIVGATILGDRWAILGYLDTRSARIGMPLVVDTNGYEPKYCPEVRERLERPGWLGRESGQLTTEEVAAWFVSRAAGVIEDSERPKTWAPAAISSFARVAMAGDLPELVAMSEDGQWDPNEYCWYDFQQCQVGEHIYRVSSTDTLWFFTKEDNDRWSVRIVPNMRWPRNLDGHDVGAMIAGAIIANKTSMADA